MMKIMELITHLLSTSFLHKKNRSSFIVACKLDRVVFSAFLTATRKGLLTNNKQETAPICFNTPPTVTTTTTTTTTTATPW
mmetsp:Transcript_57202/g.139461  ORF Transcript_57202/g.139461 Transcript_57202/m.139461 type:complete len:81 (-) Transcript_57202:2858-3100(-)